MNSKLLPIAATIAARRYSAVDGRDQPKSNKLADAATQVCLGSCSCQNALPEEVRSRRNVEAFLVADVLVVGDPEYNLYVPKLKVH
jgi:hypothetical protein